MSPIRQDRSEMRREAWKRIVAGGKPKFVVTRGMLGCGGLLLFFYILWDGIRNRSSFGIQAFVLDLIIGVPIYLVAGYIWGIWMWRTMNRRYNIHNDFR